MIFVTLGSQKFQFNRLLKKIDELVLNGVIDDRVFAQIGYSDYQPKHYWFKQFLDREEFAAMEAESEIVITHGGTGAIIGAVKSEKKVIAVPRLAKFNEHVDDHQLQIVREFGEMGIIEVCEDIDLLKEALTMVKRKKYNKYYSNTDSIIKSIDNYIDNILH